VTTVALDLSEARWHKSSYSGANGDCVEVAGNLPEVVAVRDSKHREGPALVFRDTEWDTFLSSVKVGQLDLR
jgi:hypothetical protein